MNPMEDLDDNMLTQILVRLPSCETVQACSLVNKRWCSLIYDPEFPVQFANHKKKTTTLFMGSGSNHEDDYKPPWTFVAIIMSENGDNKMIRLITKFIFESPKLSLEFLPCNTFTAKATFKDLVLCSSRETVQGGGQVHYIINPLTKQWVALPPCPLKHTPRTALICQQPYNHTRDYKFRVVEVCGLRKDRHCLGIFELVVYCSEIGEWKKIKLRVPKEAGPLGMCTGQPEIVVCKSIIYFKKGLCLIALDPFDVNDACDTTLEARVMPPLPGLGYLQESSGQLLVVHTPERRGVPCLFYKKQGASIELHMVVWKLDPNQEPLLWETTFEGFCKGTGNKTEPPCNPGLEISIYAANIGVHPYNEKLIYMYLSLENQLVSCNTQTGCIELLESSSNYSVLRFHRVEHQWWPTLVPACATPHSRTALAITSDDIIAQ